jgi:hypothetical protein
VTCCDDKNKQPEIVITAVFNVLRRLSTGITSKYLFIEQNDRKGIGNVFISKIVFLIQVCILLSNFA